MYGIEVNVNLSSGEKQVKREAETLNEVPHFPWSEFRAKHLLIEHLPLMGIKTPRCNLPRRTHKNRENNVIAINFLISIVYYYRNLNWFTLQTL
jgi:hypothetical protein